MHPVGLIRLFLALAVVVGHSSTVLGVSLGSGRLAVECFFVISGFYMAMVLETKYGLLTERRWRTFMASRIGRLYPVYLVVAVATLALAFIGIYAQVGPEEQRLTELGDLSPLTAVVAVFSNVTMLGQDVLTFFTVGGDGGLHLADNLASQPEPAYLYLAIPQAWSISVELMFYMLAPFLARWRTPHLWLLLIGSLGARVALVAVGLGEDPWSYRFFPLELAFFAAGMLAYRHGRERDWRGPLGHWSLPLLVMLTITVSPKISHPVTSVALPLLFALVVPALFELTKKNRRDRWIGELSYPLYLCHLTVLAVVLHLGAPQSGFVLIAVAVPVAALLAVLVDGPIEKVRQRRVGQAIERQAPVSPAVATAFEPAPE